jgi:hypothetical protein
MSNPYGVVLDDESLRWAAAESVSEAVIAAICLLETRSVDEIVAALTTVELEQVIKIVGRCPRCYPPGAYDALKGHRRTPLPKPQPGINPGAERLQRSAEHLGCFEVDHQLELCRLLDWNICGLGTSKDLVDVVGGATKEVYFVRAV